jgi:heterodisulfide reductase subunit D
VFEPKGSSLKEFYNDVVIQSIEECILCGKCVRKCPVIPLTSLKDKAPKETMQQMVDFLKGGVFSEEVYLRSFSCTACSHCSDICPQGIDPLLVNEATKIKLAEQGKEPPEQVNYVLAGQRPNLHEILSWLQTKPSEVRWLKQVPPQPRKTENVVFLGCLTPAVFPHKIYALLDILEKMGIDFVALAGGKLCCGYNDCFIAGKVGEADEKARELVASVKAFSPQRVIHICPGCYRQFTEFFPRFFELDFKVQFYTQFLTENMGKINFTKPLDKTITFHDPCLLARRSGGDCESSRKLLEAIPGLKLVEMKHSKKQSLCCGGAANLTYPQIGQVLLKALIREAQKTGADYLVDVCSSCHFAPYPQMAGLSFGLEDVVTLVNEAMGGKKYENKLAKYWSYGSIEKIVEESRENFEENGLTEKEVRELLPLVFPFPDS